MQAAQRDANGGLRINVEAQVAEEQLVRVQQDIISSSVKTAKLSLVIGTRTSQPAVTTSDLEQAERTIDNRRQQLLYAIARMNGAKAVAETLAKRRLFFSSLPGNGRCRQARPGSAHVKRSRSCAGRDAVARNAALSALLVRNSLPPAHSFLAVRSRPERRQHAGDGEIAAAEKPSWSSSSF